MSHAPMSHVSHMSQMSYVTKVPYVSSLTCSSSYLFILFDRNLTCSYIVNIDILIRGDIGPSDKWPFYCHNHKMGCQNNCHSSNLMHLHKELMFCTSIWSNTIVILIGKFWHARYCCIVFLQIRSGRFSIYHSCHRCHGQ